MIAEWQNSHQRTHLTNHMPGNIGSHRVEPRSGSVAARDADHPQNTDTGYLEGTQPKRDRTDCGDHGGEHETRKDCPIRYLNTNHL